MTSSGYTHPDVLALGVAEGRSEADPARIDRAERQACALVTCTVLGTRYLLMIERGGGWAVPGGRIKAGETGLQTALRGLAGETGMDAMSLTGVYMVVRPPRYAPGPQVGDEARAVTWPVHVNLCTATELPAVTAGDDARRAEWIPARNYTVLAAAIGMLDGRVSAAHVTMLREFLGDGQPQEGQAWRPAPAATGGAS
jgi:ADP-ribose pyrophosphatase YjhB (NUDIX family)